MSIGTAFSCTSYLRTFIIATCPVERGVVKAGDPPCEFRLLMGPVRMPLAPMVYDCRAPGVFSLTALWMIIVRLELEAR